MSYVLCCSFLCRGVLSKHDQMRKGHLLRTTFLPMHFIIRQSSLTTSKFDNKGRSVCKPFLYKDVAVGCSRFRAQGLQIHCKLVAETLLEPDSCPVVSLIYFIHLLIHKLFKINFCLQFSKS